MAFLSPAVVPPSFDSEKLIGSLTSCGTVFSGRSDVRQLRGLLDFSACRQQVQGSTTRPCRRLVEYRVRCEGATCACRLKVRLPMAPTLPPWRGAVAYVVRSAFHRQSSPSDGSGSHLNGKRGECASALHVERAINQSEVPSPGECLRRGSRPVPRGAS